MFKGLGSMTDSDNNSPSASLFRKLVVLGVAPALALSGGFLIAPQEGKVLGTYKDIAGVVTSCYGHTDKSLKLGVNYSDEQCTQQLKQDLESHDVEMMKFVKVPFKTEYQHAAMLSFCYNIGTNACGKSSLMGLHNAGNDAASCDQLLKWRYVNGKYCKMKENNC